MVKLPITALIIIRQKLQPSTSIRKLDLTDNGFAL